MLFYYLVLLCILLIGQWDLVKADCGVVSKKEWGGLTPERVEYLPRPVQLVIIQHTATSTCNTDAECAALVRKIQNNHMNSLGYWDIGPSFLVGGNGKVYEGSGWLHVGAHTYHYNRQSIGISFIGYFNSLEGGSRRNTSDGWPRLSSGPAHPLSVRPPSLTRPSLYNDYLKPEALEAVKALLKCGQQSGHLKPNYYLVGHRQLIATESPGMELYNEIQRWPGYLENVTIVKDTLRN